VVVSRWPKRRFVGRSGGLGDRICEEMWVRFAIVDLPPQPHEEERVEEGGEVDGEEDGVGHR